VSYSKPYGTIYYNNSCSEQHNQTALKRLKKRAEDDIMNDLDVEKP